MGRRPGVAFENWITETTFAASVVVIVVVAVAAAALRFGPPIVAAVVSAVAVIGLALSLMWRRGRSGGDERGGVAVAEFVLLIPVLLAVVAVAVVAGRVTAADGEVQGAVRAAARAASIERSPDAAQAAADQAARTELQAAGATCNNYRLQVMVGAPGGVDQARLSCVVPLVAVDWVDTAASKTVVATFSSPVDEYREGS